MASEGEDLNVRPLKTARLESLDEDEEVEAGEEVIDDFEPGEADLERLEALAAALKERFDMDEEDAAAIAEVVARQFKGEEEVNDDTLDPEVRSIFYTLEAKKLLSFRREEYTWENGERRRAFYWRVRDEELLKIHDDQGASDEESVYDQLPRSVWSRQNA